MDENKEIASRLVYQAQLMEVLGEDSNRVAALQNAAQLLKQTETAASELIADDSLTAIEGIGTEIADAILSIHDTGTTPHILELEAQIPRGVIAMLSVNGLGPKKVATLWKDLAIFNTDELHFACLENRLVRVKGFGEKTQKRLLKTLQHARDNGDQFLYADLVLHQQSILSLLRETLGPHTKLSLTGGMRRQLPLLDKIEYLIEADAYKEVMLMLIRSADYEILTAGSDSLQARIRNTEIPITFHFCAVNFFLELFRSTGPSKHTDLIPLEESTLYTSEEAIYEQARLPYIPPVLREGEGEIHKTYRNAVPSLVEASHIQGIMHVHSDWSYGLHSLQELAQAAQNQGMAYLGVCEHVQSATYPLGLSEARMAKQAAAIDSLNKEMGSFRILKGIEVEILPDGSLSSGPLVLSKFDFVMASAHSGFEQDRAVTTERFLKAIGNPFVSMLGHLTGRLLLGRNGFDLDHKAIIDACAEYQVALELNGNPNRLDLDWKWIRYAAEKEVMISINSDAYSIDTLNDFQWGIPMAQKGMLSPDLTLNTKELSAIEEWFLSKRKRRLV